MLCNSILRRFAWKLLEIWDIELRDSKWDTELRAAGKSDPPPGLIGTNTGHMSQSF